MQWMKRIACALALESASSLSACASASRAVYDSQLTEYRSSAQAHQRAAAEATRALHMQRLSRAALIDAVLERNPSIESARQAWRAALARYRQAGSLDDPMLMASFAPLSIAPSPHSHFGYEVQISQRLPLGGKLEAQAAIAAAQAERAGTGYSELRLKLAVMASELFDDYALALRALVIQAQHLELVSALKDNVTAAYSSTDARLQDSLQAEAELARISYQQTVYETQRDIAVAQLNALLHRESNAPLPEPTFESEQPKSEASLHSVSSTALTQRPEIASARAQVRVARARTQAADREFYPDLTLSTSYNSMWDMPEHRWMAGVSINVPLQRARRNAMVDEASAMHNMSESDLLSALDAARGEVAVAQRQLQQAQRAVLLYEQRLVPLAHSRVDALRASFTTSRSNFMSVLEAERALRTTELELEMARAELGKRSAALDRALGQLPGFEERAQLETKEVKP